MSVIGIIHTVLSLFPIMIAIALLLQQGHINPHSKPGVWYSLTTLATVASSFAIMKTGQLSDGHFLGIFILVLLTLAYLLPGLPALQKSGPAIERFMMSTSFFLMFVPATVETLSRFPLDAPLAPNGPESPLVKQMLGIFFLLYLAGLYWQYKQLKHSAVKA